MYIYILYIVYYLYIHMLYAWAINATLYLFILTLEAWKGHRRYEVGRGNGWERMGCRDYHEN